MHGGAVEGHEPNRAWSHNVARLVPFARALRKVPGPLAVARLRFRVRGWNGEAMPVEDARWALAQVRAAYPGVPIALVGHSMGGRVAMFVGDEPDVRLVVGLAPWVEPGDPRPGAGAAHRPLHGDRDVICSLGAHPHARSSRCRPRGSTRRSSASPAPTTRCSCAPGCGRRSSREVVEATFARELGGYRRAPIRARSAPSSPGSSTPAGVTIDI